MILATNTHKVAPKKLSYENNRTTGQERIKKAEMSENHYYMKEILLKLNCTSNCAVNALLLILIKCLNVQQRQLK